MDDGSRVLIRIPATTANLGPGFDTLGMTLDIWNEVEIVLSGESLSIDVAGEGENLLSRDISNRIYQVFVDTLFGQSKNLPHGLKISCKNQIPISSGLGSSAAAVLAGILSANALWALNMDDLEILNTAASYEGHADNLAAAMFGGLVLTYRTDSGYQIERIHIPQLDAVLVIPEVRLSTKEARSALPELISTEDAVFNISRTALLINAFHNQDFSLLKSAMQDRMHQPHRTKLIAGADEALQAAFEVGALGAALSGAGPGLIAFCDRSCPDIGDAMRLAFQKKGMRTRVIYTKTTNKAAQIQIKKARS